MFSILRVIRDSLYLSVILFCVIVLLTFLEDTKSDIVELSIPYGLPHIAAEGFIRFEKGRIMGRSRGIFYKNLAIKIPPPLPAHISVQSIVDNGWLSQASWKISWTTVFLGFIHVFIVVCLFMSTLSLLRKVKKNGIGFSQ